MSVVRLPDWYLQLFHVVRVRLYLTGMPFSSQIKSCKSRQIAVSAKTDPPTPDQAGSADGGHCSSHPVEFRYVERHCGLRPFWRFGPPGQILPARALHLSYESPNESHAPSTPDTAWPGRATKRGSTLQQRPPGKLLQFEPSCRSEGEETGPGSELVPPERSELDQRLYCNPRSDFWERDRDGHQVVTPQNV